MTVIMRWRVKMSARKRPPQTSPTHQTGKNNSGLLRGQQTGGRVWSAFTLLAAFLGLGAALPHEGGAGGSGLARVSTTPLSLWSETLASSAATLFPYKYCRKQTVLQLPSRPPCQLTLKLDIVLLLTRKHQETHTNGYGRRAD